MIPGNRRAFSLKGEHGANSCGDGCDMIVAAILGDERGHEQVTNALSLYGDWAFYYVNEFNR